MEINNRPLIKALSYVEESCGPISILRSEWAWRRVRNEHFELEPMCQMCGETGTCDVHHIIPWQYSEELRYDHDNLVTLCRRDHFLYGHLRNWHRYCPEILELCQHAQLINPHVEWVGRVHRDFNLAA